MAIYQDISKYAKDAKVYGFGAVASTMFMSSNAMAKVDVAAPVSTLVTDGSAAITAIGTGLLTLAGIAVVFKWVKAAFFG